jgi:signal transduction histidine kinase
MTTVNGKPRDMNPGGHHGISSCFKNAIVSGFGGRIFLSFGALMLVTMLVLPTLYFFGLPFMGIRGEYDRDIREMMDNLTLMADMKQDHLVKWISERREDARLLSGSRIVRANLDKLLRKAHRYDLTKIDKKTLAGIFSNEEEYRELSDYMEYVKTSYGHYKEILIADADTGIIVASTMPGETGGTVNPSRMDGSARYGKLTEYIGFRPDPYDDDIHLVITRRIDTCAVSEGPCGHIQPGAVLMMFADIEDAVNPILQTGERLGETGEVFLVDGNQMLLTALKYPLADGSKARPLKNRINTLPAKLAAGGMDGAVFTADYRGRQVLAVFRHLRITPDIGLGMVVKMDADEVYAPAGEFVRYFSIINVFGFIMLLAITCLISRKISRPVMELVGTAKLISGGDLSARATNYTSGEMKILTETFNTMVERLENQQKYLEARVSEELQARRKQEQILIQQSKLASMGEMIGAIAHQWRQPLNAIGIMIQDLKDAHGFDELTPEYLDENIKNTMAQLAFMSKTIDDFRNYFKPSKGKIPFGVNNEVRNALNILSAQMNNSFIEITLNNSVPDGVAITGYPNEFIQVLINILNNARDAILTKRAGGLYTSEDGRVAGGRISIGTRDAGDYVRIDINNDGGAISEQIMDKIFEPYFTTKFASAGTGIGLYMSKVIIENNMGGKLYAENTGEGVMFTVELRK